MKLEEEIVRCSMSGLYIGNKGGGYEEQYCKLHTVPFKDKFRCQYMKFELIQCKDRSYETMAYRCLKNVRYRK